MPSQEQVNKRERQQQKMAEQVLEEDLATAAKVRERGQETIDLTDELMEEIDAVLLETEEINFVQKGGQ